MADNFKNTHNKSVKTGNSSKHIGIKRQRKKKQNTKRKNKQYFKRKRLIRTLALRKKKLKMNSTSTSAVSHSTNRWKHGDDIAFWKARAISLEFENKMLHEHIKQMYISMIPQNQQLLQNDEEYVEQNQECGEDETVSKRKNEKIKKEKMKNEKEIEDEEDSKPPLEQISKKREEEMKILYGSAWRTIIGMETAVQLNYDVTVEKNKSKYWPVVPIKI